MTKEEMTQVKATIIVILLAFGLTACGDGDGDASNRVGGDEEVSNVGTSSPPTSALNGIYEGKFTQQGFGTSNVQALVQGGRIIAVSNDETIYNGKIKTTESVFSGKVTAYRINGGIIGTSSLKGTFEKQSAIRGSFSGGAGNGDFSLAYDPIYERDSDLSLLNDVWFFTNGSFSISVSINPDGSFNGSDTDGCNYAGNLAIIDPNFDVYRLYLKASNCGQLNGRYNGFAALADETGKNDTLVVGGSNEKFTFVYDFSRR